MNAIRETVASATDLAELRDRFESLNKIVTEHMFNAMAEMKDHIDALYAEQARGIASIVEMETSLERLWKNHEYIAGVAGSASNMLGDMANRMSAFEADNAQETRELIAIEKQMNEHRERLENLENVYMQLTVGEPPEESE